MQKELAISEEYFPKTTRQYTHKHYQRNRKIIHSNNKIKGFVRNFMNFTRIDRGPEKPEETAFEIIKTKMRTEDQL